MPTLDEILTEIELMLDTPNDSLTDEQRAAMDAYLDELAALEADKVDAWSRFLRSAEARAKACKEEAARLTAKAKGIESRLLASKGRLLESMQRRGLKKLSGDVYSISTRKTTRVEVAPEAYGILEEFGFAKVIPEQIQPDKVQIAKELKAGHALPGCKLVESQSLQVR